MYFLISRKVFCKSNSFFNKASTAEFKETLINPEAPAYSVETLGWGGRLSGPNDGAVALNVTYPNGDKYERLAMSSCMSCHSAAQ